MEPTRIDLPEFDLPALAQVEDPHALYAAWRQAGPLVKGGPGQWAVPRHADVSSRVPARARVPAPSVVDDLVDVTDYLLHDCVRLRNENQRLRLHLLGQGVSPAAADAIAAGTMPTLPQS